MTSFITQKRPTQRAQMKLEVKGEKDTCRINRKIVKGGTTQRQRLRKMSETLVEVV